MLTHISPTPTLKEILTFSMRKISLFIFAIFLGLNLTTHAVWAAENTPEPTLTSAPTITSTTKTVPTPTLQTKADATNEKPFPSPFGLFLQGLRERFWLAVTFDSNKKAELATLFTEERLNIAAAALHSGNTKIQTQAQKQLDRALVLAEKARKEQENSLKNPTDETIRMVKYASQSFLRQQRTFDEMEKTAANDSLENVLEARQNMTEKNHRLQNAISNEHIPEDVRAQLTKIQERIDQHLSEVKNRINQMKELRTAAQQGDQSAAQKIEQLKTQRLEEIRQHENEDNATETENDGDEDEMKLNFGNRKSQFQTQSQQRFDSEKSRRDREDHESREEREDD